MVRKLTIPIRFSPETVKLLKKVKKQLKESFPKKRVTYDAVIIEMINRLGWK